MSLKKPPLAFILAPKIFLVLFKCFIILTKISKPNFEFQKLLLRISVIVFSVNIDALYQYVIVKYDKRRRKKKSHKKLWKLVFTYIFIWCFKCAVIPHYCFCLFMFSVNFWCGRLDDVLWNSNWLSQEFILLQ